MVSVSVSVSPLRPLSRVASDYSSDSVVCIGILRPLRPLREIKIRVFLFSRKDRRERKVLFTFRISRLRWSGRKLRYDKSAQRVFIHPLPPAGYYPCLRGRVSYYRGRVHTILTVPLRQAGRGA